MENASYFKEVKLIGAGSYQAPVSQPQSDVPARGRMRGAPALIPEPAPKHENVPAVSQDKITFTIEMGLK